jgi:hypothetical protein
MRNISETETARHPKSLIVPITIGAMGIVGLSFAGQAELSKIDENREHKASSEARHTIKDCRDTVRCTLGKISSAFEKKFPGIRSVESKLTGQTITLDGQTFMVSFSNKVGNVLIDRDGTKYLATHDLGNTVESVNSVLRKKEETK